MLAEMELRGGDRRSKTHDESLKLADLGIGHHQSSRWQRLASLPEPRRPAPASNRSRRTAGQSPANHYSGSTFFEADRQRIAAAFHEAGHAVAAVVLGGRVHLAVLDDTPRIEFDVIASGREPEVTYAGPWCEARWLAGGHPGPLDIHRVLAANPSDDKSLCAAGGPAVGAGVVSLLDRCWPAVKAVTKQLFYAGEIGHADVCAALGLSDDGGPGSLDLAVIRSGSAPAASP